MNEGLAGLVARAEQVLDDNWTGASTKPAPGLYPHQWNWDSGFIAIGYARYCQERACAELSSLFEAQWANGMLPQIVFDPDCLGDYFPEPDFWQGERSPHHPEGHLTSGITMPPVHAISARRIVDLAEERPKVMDWLEEIYPRILALHEYLHRDRDPEGEGLVYIRHPWESGLDNSPVWDAPLEAMEIDPERLPDYERRDLSHGIPGEQRPTRGEYDRYVYLVDLFRRHDYDEEAIYRECPFRVQDPLFNAVLARADEDLAALGDMLGEDTARLRRWSRDANEAMRDKMWHESHAAFDVYDLVAGEPVGTLTASGFLPLLSGAPSQAQARAIFEMIDSHAFCPMHDDSCFSIPNYSLEGDFLDAVNYWRGPVWINTNWLLADGLTRYGFEEKAESVRWDIVELVRRCGFHEYFDPFEGTGYGADDFSWTAALFLDVAHDLAPA